MPASCSVAGCTNRHKAGGSVQFFGFPLKNDNLLKSWICSLRRENFAPTKASKVCSDHFQESDYLVRPGTYVRRLKPDAVPSLFPGFPLYCHIKKEEPEDLPEDVCQSQNDELQSDQCFKAHLEFVKLVDEKEVQTEESALPHTVQSLKQQIKILQQKLRRRDRKIFLLKELLSSQHRSFKS
ncbi:hypothetical protein MTP99_002515 [Tenebrio molitor]|nr:hypothetical protein MTP99_002515 [Tenebrio molitor]CAH1378702.1 unnamed protein product [Tenebrio molitor]